MTQSPIQAPLKQGAFSLKKSQLFTKRDFTELFSSSAQKKHGRLFILFYQNGDESRSAFGVVVSKKNAKTSVRRNLVKRLVREHFRLSQPELLNTRVMLVAKAGVDKVSKDELQQDLQQLFSFLKKLNYSKNEKVNS